MIINEAGEYTLQYTATDACGNSTTVERELTVEAPPVYGVSWLQNTSPVLTRTDKSADFPDPVPQMSDGNGGWTVGSSPFDDIMPWSGMQIIDDADAGKLVSIPKFYYKIDISLTQFDLQISPQPLEGFLTSPAHADRGDGVGERDVVYVGRYHCDATNYKSVSGALPKVSMTRGDFRTNIHSIGSSIWQNDFAMLWTIRMLYLVEFANWNVQNTIGYGCGSPSFVLTNNGETDSMTYHTGTTASARSDNGFVQYRYIENLWANVIEFTDGIRHNAKDLYVYNNPSEFSDSIGGVLVGTLPTSTGLILKYNAPSIQDDLYAYALIPGANTNSNFETYVCDKYYYNGSGVTSYSGGAYTFSSGKENGLFCQAMDRNDSYTHNVLGSRLMKLPSA